MAELNQDSWRAAMLQSAEQWDANTWGLLLEQQVFIGRWADTLVNAAVKQGKAITMEALWWYSQGVACSATFIGQVEFLKVPAASNVPHLITCCVASRIVAGSVPLPEAPAGPDLDPDQAGG